MAKDNVVNFREENEKKVDAVKEHLKLLSEENEFTAMITIGFGTGTGADIGTSGDVSIVEILGALEMAKINLVMIGKGIE